MIAIRVQAALPRLGHRCRDEQRSLSSRWQLSSYYYKEPSCLFLVRVAWVCTWEVVDVFTGASDGLWCLTLLAGLIPRPCRRR